MPRVALKKYCFVMSAAFNELEDLYLLKTGCDLSGKLSVVLADPSIQPSQCAESDRLHSRFVLEEQH